MDIADGRGGGGAATWVWQTPAVAGETGGAAAAGTWMLGDLRVNRIGFGAMRLPQRSPAFAPGAIPRQP